MEEGCQAKPNIYTHSSDEARGHTILSPFVAQPEPKGLYFTELQSIGGLAVVFTVSTSEV